jgi:hypothetical protein
MTHVSFAHFASAWATRANIVQTSQQDALIPRVRKGENTSIRLYHLQADETQWYGAYRVQIPEAQPS